MQLTLLPVYSKLADPSTVPDEIAGCLPSGWQLSQHQVETYNALINPDVGVVINTAMTGDGKSLAGQLPLLVGGSGAEILALYPTNELIQDQLVHAQQTLQRWSRPERWVGDVYGTRLDALVAEMEYSKRGGVLEQQLLDYKLLLTNPDIFHAVMQFFYKQPGKAPSWLVRSVGESFRQITFDEFHIFDLPMAAAVLTGVLLLYEQMAGALKTLLLSATPDPYVVALFDAAGLRVRQIIGSYQHGADPGSGWRPILRGCDLHFPTYDRAEAWLETHLEDTLIPFFKQRGVHAKGAIITGSLAAAKRIVSKFKPRLESAGIKVGENTGLTPLTQRRDSYAADLLIGTSTVDIGVDFQINFLLFEGSDAGNFLQRLGRLGRHDGYVRDSASYQFHDYVAYALVPEFVRDRLFKGWGQEPPLLQSGATIVREELATAIQAVFPPPARFPDYLPCWGRFQPAYVISRLHDPTIRSAYAPLIERLQPRYERVFHTKLSKAWGVGKQMRQAGQGKLVDEARSLRGGSPFDCGVLLPDHPEPQTYDLLWLLANATLELLDEQVFVDHLRQHGMAEQPFKRAALLACFRLLGYLDERSDVLMVLPPAMAEWGAEQYGVAQVLKGIEIEVTNGAPPWINSVNRRLRLREVVGLVMPNLHPLELRRRLQLPMLFPLQRYRDVQGQQGTIAFARQALILDTALRRRKLPSTGLAAIIL